MGLNSVLPPPGEPLLDNLLFLFYHKTNSKKETDAHYADV